MEKKELITKAHETKGKIIDLGAYVEFLINKIIALHYAKKGKEVELSSVLKRLNEEAIFNVLKKILPHYRSVVADSKEFMNQINLAKKLRNEFAHGILGLENEREKEQGIILKHISTLKDTDGKHFKAKKYSFNEIDIKLIEIHSCVKVLFAIQKIAERNMHE